MERVVPLWLYYATVSAVIPVIAVLVYAVLSRRINKQLHRQFQLIRKAADGGGSAPFVRLEEQVADLQDEFAKLREFQSQELRSLRQAITLTREVFGDNVEGLQAAINAAGGSEKELLPKLQQLILDVAELRQQVRDPASEPESRRTSRRRPEDLPDRSKPPRSSWRE